MATTPEGKVKKKVKETLATMGAYYVMPVTGGFGNSGIPDILCCYEGRFIGIECKANGGTVTQLQMKNLNEIVTQGGISLIIDETGIGIFALLMTSWDSNGLPKHGYISELLKRSTDGAKPTE